MANLRDIRKRISSVQSTKQITRTMEMVSTAKIRRALDRSVQSEPYKAALTDVMLTVAQDAQAAGDNPMLKRRETVRNGLVIAIASDRGLAGGFNVGVERAAERIMGEWERAGAKAQVITCGRKPQSHRACDALRGHLGRPESRRGAHDLELRVPRLHGRRARSRGRRLPPCEESC